PATTASAAGGGCHAKANDFYFAPGHANACTSEIVKGSQYYQQIYPGSTWNEYLMHLCFEGGDGKTGLGLEKGAEGFSLASSDAGKEVMRVVVLNAMVGGAGI
ncbi:MAG: hypothetical protein Q9186_006527, partial [Xanthomendoza sp. 1 TL-2023]